MDTLPTLPTLPGKAENGWEPAALGPKDSIAKKSHALRLMGMTTGIRRFSNGYGLWKRQANGEEIPEYKPGDLTMIMGPINEVSIGEFRRALNRPPLGNEEGGYDYYNWEV